MDQEKKDFIFDVIFDVISQTLAAPFEYLKINLQLDSKAKGRSKDQIKSLISGKTYKIFTGNLMGCLSFLVKKHLINYSFNHLEDYVDMSDDHYLGQIYSIMMHSYLPFIISYPFEILKTRMIYSESKENNYLECSKSIYREKSYNMYIESFFYSFLQVPIYKIYNSFHRYMMKKIVINPNKKQSTILENIATILVSDLISSFLVYPFDTLSRRTILKDVKKKDGSNYKLDTNYNLSLFNGIEFSFLGFLTFETSKYVLSYIKDWYDS